MSKYNSTQSRTSNTFEGPVAINPYKFAFEPTNLTKEKLVFGPHLREAEPNIEPDLS